MINVSASLTTFHPLTAARLGFLLLIAASANAVGESKSSPFQQSCLEAFIVALNSCVLSACVHAGLLGQVLCLRGEERDGIGLGGRSVGGRGGDKGEEGHCCRLNKGSPTSLICTNARLLSRMASYNSHCTRRTVLVESLPALNRPSHRELMVVDCLLLVFFFRGREGGSNERHVGSGEATREDGGWSPCLHTHLVGWWRGKEGQKERGEKKGGRKS